MRRNAQSRLIMTDDLPLFSGTAPTATLGAYEPKTATHQLDMFGPRVAFGPDDMTATSKPLDLPKTKAAKPPMSNDAPGAMSQKATLDEIGARWVQELGNGSLMIWRPSAAYPGRYGQNVAISGKPMLDDLWILANYEPPADVWALDEIISHDDNQEWILSRGDESASLVWYPGGYHSNLNHWPI